MKTSQPPLFQILKGLHQDELTFVADQLSQNREKWTYDKRSKSSVRKAIVSHTSNEDLAKLLGKSMGRKLPSGGVFAKTFQFQRVVFGPIGLLESVADRSRYESDAIIEIVEKFVRGDELIEKFLVRFQDKIPEDAKQTAAERKDLWEYTLSQLLLAYLRDNEICDFFNSLLAMEDIRIEITGLHEVIDYWIITPYGLLLMPENEAIENLAELLMKNYDEKELDPELKDYSGDFRTRLLEYCIMESPQTILQKLFGLPTLRRIAKELGFASGKIGNTQEVVSLIMIGLGFNVPPTLVGINAYLNSIRKCEREFSEAREIGERSGIMSRVFVIMERALRDVCYFYINFLWDNLLESSQEAIEDETPELNVKQVKLKALDNLLHKKFRMERNKSFERLGFGDFIGLIRRLNKELYNSKSLRNRMTKSFGRTPTLERYLIKSLDFVSPFRACFTHIKDYPGDEKCSEIIKQIERLLNEVQSRKVYPSVIRIRTELSDEYGKSYAECIDENGDKWLVYTDEYLETSRPYFMHSITPRIAVNPIIVENVL